MKFPSSISPRAPSSRWGRIGRSGRGVALAVAVVLSLGWSPQTTRQVAWSAVAFFPPDLENQVRRNHRRFDQGIQRGLEAPPAWRAGSPGRLETAIQSQVSTCVAGLREPIPLDSLVEELGVLATWVVDANDPLAVAHDDVREADYSAEYSRYVTTIMGRMRLVHYGLDPDLVYRRDLDRALVAMMARSRELYPFVGAEFYRTGALRRASSFDDRSLAFGVAAVALSHAMTDVSNLAAYIWRGGGGLVPTPMPTPTGHIGPTVTLAPLDGGFPDRDRPDRGKPVLPPSSIQLPPP